MGVRVCILTLKLTYCSPNVQTPQGRDFPPSVRPHVTAVSHLDAGTCEENCQQRPGGAARLQGVRPSSHLVTIPHSLGPHPVLCTRVMNITCFRRCWSLFVWVVLVPSSFILLTEARVRTEQHLMLFLFNVGVGSVFLPRPCVFRTYFCMYVCMCVSK